PELRMVLLGCTGAGKSSTANAILGTVDFRETETTKCEMSSRIVEGRNISVIDTPGMNNTSLTEKQWRIEIQRCAELSHPGPHVFLLVIRLWNFTKEDRKAVWWIREHFGEEALKFTVILFTGREELSHRQWRKFSQDAQTLDFIRNFRGHYFAMNSKREVNPNQIKKLLQKVETVVQCNGGLYYPQEMSEVQNKNIMEETQEEERQTSWQEEDQVSKKQTLERKSNAEDQTKETQEKTIEKEEPQWNTAEEIQTWLASGARGGENRASSCESDNESLERNDMMKLEHKIEEKTLWRLEEQNEELESIPSDLRQILENIEEQEERGATGGGLDSVSDLRIVLLGGTEVGKSSSGNTILGREAFGKERFTDTIDAWRHDGVLKNKTITVVDTGHLFDLMCGCVNDEVAPWLSDLMDQFFALCNPGPHVFLAVVKTPGDSIDMISSINRVFGSEFLKRTLILITHGDECGTDTLEKTPDLQRFIDVYEVGCHVFNNKEKEDRTQVTELLEKIQVLMQKNEGRCYTTEMYQNRKIEVLVENNEGRFTK
ncbi:GTPase IMAP family member 4-like, partial [Trichomycterus rosablanca]|uniref:GTPase IMAP family member 4-like n=1 Tax=Trichomycterus rosablanca TaxID=2290929 RepID=UPI002F353543